MGNDVNIQTVTIRSDCFSAIPIVARPRNFFSPVHVGHDVDVVSITTVADRPDATLTVNGQPVAISQASPPIPLEVGRNIVRLVLTGRGGGATREVQIKVFRAHPTPVWTRESETSLWSPRDTAGELVFDDRMWLLGGFTPSLANDVWCSTDGVCWERTGTVPTSKGIDIPVAFVFRDRMWVSDVDGALFSSTNGADWSLVTAQTPWKGRNAAGGLVFGGKIRVMGGMGKGRLFNDIWSSSDGVQWTCELENAPWDGRQIHNPLLELDGRIWLIGGGFFGSSYHPFVAYNDVWSSEDGIHWEMATGAAPWTPRIWSSAAVYRDRLWLLGGFRSEPTWENLGDVWYSSDGAHWQQLLPVPTCRHSGNNNVPVVVSQAMWTPRHESSVYAFREALWLAGGMVWPLVNDVWRLAISGFTFLTQPVLEGYVGARYTYAAHADFNRSRQAVFYRLPDRPGWLTVHRSTGMISGIPTAAEDQTVTVEAFDAAGETTRQTYRLHILQVA